MKSIYFYKHLVTPQVFFQSKYTYALVNLRPLVPGHVLLVPLRTSAYRLADLTPEESADYMLSLQLIHRFIMHAYKADSLNILIQDGPESGQSVPHLHTHIIPRYRNDMEDAQFYQGLEKWDAETDFNRRKLAFHNGSSFSVNEDKREPRSMEVMEKEAEWLSEELTRFKDKIV
ncbi:uncharacterized protein KQ657_005237 [Scheffersomyces spartinae]|uniref:Bis(5'-adenosyl)-triphosphatase n=1 Tax=Scheffersomyces spartinae TaxID=45513 RepID=A0A9P7VAX3_9ASCO|nr:uncharacterized protein KQ657_005237 [Scheffersomyces spartinae]KAG7194034.1 hypothetical protein KQ657_005237 [Scheffersomyces spartinae]